MCDYTQKTYTKRQQASLRLYTFKDLMKVLEYVTDSGLKRQKLLTQIYHVNELTGPVLLGIDLKSDKHRTIHINTCTYILLEL